MAFAAASAIIVAGLGGALAWRYANKAEIDPSTMCAKSPLPGHTFIIVDRTDPLSPSQARRIGETIRMISSELKPGAKLTLAGIDAGPMNGLSDPLLSLCNPGTGADANPLYSNPEFAKQKYRLSFGKPVEEFLSSIAEASTPSQRSPIIEAIFDVAGRSDFRTGQANRRLVIISDLLQHVDAYSHYKIKADFDSFSKSAYGTRSLPSLTGTTVTVFYLMRSSGDSRLQTNAHIEFWEKFFVKAGATVDTIEKVR